MDLRIQSIVGVETTEVMVSERVFGARYNESLVHQVVTAYMSGARAGTKQQKNRAAVSGGGSKPWRQKGTGRARAGTSRSPLWRGGGVTFPAHPRDFSQKVNRKMYRGALRSILSELVRQDRLVVIEEFRIAQPKTKELTNKLSVLGLLDVLIVTDATDENLRLAARNLYEVDVRDVDQIDPVSLIGFEKVLLTSAAVKHLEGYLA